MHAVRQIRFHRIMGQKTSVLKDVADPTLFGRQINAPCRIKQDVTIHGHTTGIGFQQSGNHIDDGRFSGARRSEKGGYPGSGPLENGIDGKIALLSFEINFQNYPFKRWENRRAAISERNKAIMATATDRTHRRMASDSPPGICVRV